uniref:Uncharacterized protein n=1 Tax=Branchiostoma floridae TaxID=7739 RepID=C3YFH0_BRAFL|eukprot:XP_002604923.1 hypothetical protein BRAFLDRAFT_77227 [Branchiostoma floridae]
MKPAKYWLEELEFCTSGSYGGVAEKSWRGFPRQIAERFLCRAPSRGNTSRPRSAPSRPDKGRKDADISFIQCSIEASDSRHRLLTSPPKQVAKVPSRLRRTNPPVRSVVFGRVPRQRRAETAKIAAQNGECSAIFATNAERDAVRKGWPDVVIGSA